MDPATRLYYVEVQEPDMHEPSGDLERLQDALADAMADRYRALRVDLPVLSKLQPALRKGDWAVTVALHQGHDDTHERILDIWPGFYEGRIYGLAIDLGSTTIAAHLCDLRNGEVMAVVGRDEPADPLRRGPDEPGQLCR